MSELDNLLNELAASQEEEMMDPPRPPKHPVLINGEFPVHVIDCDTVRFWCQFNEAFELESLSHWPFYTSIDYGLECVGLEELLDIHCWPKRHPGLDFCMEHGLTAEQPFYVEIYLHTYVTYGGEGDWNVDWNIIDRKPVPLLEAATRIENYLNS